MTHALDPGIKESGGVLVHNPPVCKWGIVSPYLLEWDQNSEVKWNLILGKSFCAICST